jgi:hypothetical protein
MSYTALRIATFAIIAVALAGCSKVEYDFKSLGFANKDDMEAAFAKGYHTKKKLDEMIKPPVVAAAPTPAPAQPAAASESAPQPQAPAAPQAAPSAAPAAEAAAPPTCDSVKACADAMLAAAKREALPSAMESALRIDAMPKPQRGDRKVARKLNAEGLEALKQKKLPEAAATLTKALQADPADEEIISNLIYTYSEDGNFTKAEQLAYDGLLLNPRRANIWLPIAIAKQKQNKTNEALQAMWLAWQFSGDKQKMLTLLDKRIAEEADGGLKSMYANAKAWAIEGKKPSF